MSEVKAGTILVAHPALPDPMFARSVILIVLQDDGFIGVNLAQAPVADRIYVGGPMEAPVPLILHKATEKSDPKRALGDSGYSVSSLAEVTEDPRETFRKETSALFLGYAGWGPDQLAEEIQMGAWQTSPVALDELLKVAPEARYDLATAGIKA